MLINRRGILATALLSGAALAVIAASGQGTGVDTSSPKLRPLPTVIGRWLAVVQADPIEMVTPLD